MKVDAMVFRFSKPSSSAPTSPSAGNTAQRGQAALQQGPAPGPPSGLGCAAPGGPGGWGQWERMHVAPQPHRHCLAGRGPRAQSGRV